MLCASHRGWSWSHLRRRNATLQGRKAKAALQDGTSQRDQARYKGQCPVEPRLCRIIYALADGDYISYRGGAKLQAGARKPRPVAR